MPHYSPSLTAVDNSDLFKHSLVGSLLALLTSQNILQETIRQFIVIVFDIVDAVVSLGSFLSFTVGTDFIRIAVISFSDEVTDAVATVVVYVVVLKIIVFIGTVIVSFVVVFVVGFLLSLFLMLLYYEHSFLPLSMTVVVVTVSALVSYDL